MTTHSRSRSRSLGHALAALTIAAAILVLGGIPSSSLVERVVFERSAPPLPLALDGTPRDAAVAVHASAPDGSPIAGARVHVFALRDDDAAPDAEGPRAYAAGEGATDRTGRARIARIPRGETWVLVDAPGRARASSSLVLEAGERAVEVVMAPEHRLDVDVRDERGAPIAGAEVEVTEADPLPVGARAGADGVARVTRLAAPPWIVTARATGFGEVSTRGVREGEPLRVVLLKLGSIAARVVDEEGAPVAGAQLRIASPSLWPARLAECDAKGAVTIRALPSGTYALRATSHDRASPIELGLDLARGEEKAVTLHLAPSEVVAVRVVGDDDAPVAGARVTLAESGVSPFPLEATTDKGGRARLGPIARGSASLAVRAEGFVPRAMSVPDPLPGEVAVTLAHAGTIEGRVSDARGFPIGGATIEVIGTGFDGSPIDDDPRRARFTEAQFASALAGPRPLVPAGELGVMPGPVPRIPAVGAPIAGAPPGGVAAPSEPWVTRDDGTYRASPASPGRLRVLVHHPQYVDAMSDITSLSPGGKAVLDVVLRAGGVLEGRVVDAAGGPVASARVVMAATRGALERATRTATDGTFGFAAVPGEVVLLVSRDDEGTSPEVRAEVAVPEGGKKAITLELPPARDPLPVTVRDDRGYPIEAAQVSVASLDAASALRETIFTNGRGEGALPRARGVTLRATVSAPGHAPSVVAVEAAAASLEVTLSPAEGLAGEVRSTRGDPIAGAEITLYAELGVRRARSGADGAFSFADLAPGDARLLARAPGFAPAMREVSVARAHGGRATSAGRVELAPGGAVEGVVLDARGDPIPGARVAEGLVPTYLAAGSPPPGLAITDARGRFKLLDLAEGQRALEVYAPDVGRAHADVRVVSGQTIRDVRISLFPSEGGEHARDTAAAGSLAVTLGETDDPPEVILAAVAEGSEAERAGLAPGDVVLAVQGRAVETMAAARAGMSGPLGDDVLLTVRRGAKTETLRVAREPVRR